MKSICESMSKKTVFILRFLVQGNQLRTVLHSIMLFGVEQAANSRGQPLYRRSGCLTCGDRIRQRLDQLALQHPPTKQPTSLRLSLAAAQAFPRAGNHIMAVESKHLLGARQRMLVFAELRSDAPLQLNQLVDHA